MFLKKEWAENALKQAAKRTAADLGGGEFVLVSHSVACRMRAVRLGGVGGVMVGMVTSQREVTPPCQGPDQSRFQFPV